MELVESFISIVHEPGIVAAFAVFVNVVLWRAWRKEAAAKDALYDRYIGHIDAIVADYHDFAHTLDRWAQAYEREERARGETQTP